MHTLILHTKLFNARRLGRLAVIIQGLRVRFPLLFLVQAFSEPLTPIGQRWFTSASHFMFRNSRGERHDRLE